MRSRPGPRLRIRTQRVIYTRVLLAIGLRAGRRRIRFNADVTAGIREGSLLQLLQDGDYCDDQWN